MQNIAIVKLIQLADRIRHDVCRRDARWVNFDNGPQNTLVFGYVAAARFAGELFGPLKRHDERSASCTDLPDFSTGQVPPKGCLQMRCLRGQPQFPHLSLLTRSKRRTTSQNSFVGADASLIRPTFFSSSFINISGPRVSVVSSLFSPLSLIKCRALRPVDESLLLSGTLRWIYPFGIQQRPSYKANQIRSKTSVLPPARPFGIDVTAPDTKIKSTGVPNRFTWSSTL